MTKINNFNSKNTRWSEDIIKQNTKWVITKENMKWRYQMHNKNYAWLYRVFLSEVSNEFMEELKKKESVYFRDLLIMHKTTVISLAEKAKSYDENKIKTTRFMSITPYFWGFRWGKFLNDNTNVFGNVMANKGKENLREYYIKFTGDDYGSHSFYNLLNVNTKSGVGSKMKQMGLKQITDEKYSNIISRKMENNLSMPHYFFSNRYISRSNILPQIRNWPNTIYSYIKPTLVNIKYIDLITTEFLKVFFNPKLLKRKVIKGNLSEWKVFAGMSIVPLKLFNKYMNELVKFTSQRSQVDIKNVINYSSNILSLPWVKKELAWAKTFKRIFKSRRDKFDRGFTPKRAIEFSKKRNIWLSKPLFRHTASNVIIDLYLFNNKSYKLTKYHHMIKVRAIYKYMYSMYANYDKIIQSIISRPRIFYINIIDPKMHEYYSRVIRSYENALIHFSKNQFMYFLLDLLKWNLNNKIFSYLSSAFKFNYKLSFNTNILNSKNIKFGEVSNDNNKSDKSLSLITSFPEELSTAKTRWEMPNDNDYVYNNQDPSVKDVWIDKSNSSFGVWVNEKSNNKIQKYIPLNWNNTNNNINDYIFRSLSLKNKIYKYRSVYNYEKKNILINDYITLINNDVYKIEKKKVRNLSWWKNEYYLLKELGPRYNAKAMDKLKDEELERNALIPLKFEDYPRWSKELLLNSRGKNKNKKIVKVRKVKMFGKDKFSLSKYKWDLKKGKKWKTLTPKFWEEKMEKYNTFSKAQKADTNPNQKWVYDNKTKLKVHISQFRADNSIFDKIKKKINLKNKIKKTLKKKLNGKLGKDNYKSKNSNYKVIKNQVNKNMIEFINKDKNKKYTSSAPSAHKMNTQAQKGPEFTYFNNIDLITDTKDYQGTIPSLDSRSNNINSNSNQLELNDKNVIKINIKPINKNLRNKFNQGPAVIKEDTIISSNSSNYKGKPYNKNKGIESYKGKTDQYTKFGNENSKYKFDNINNVRFKDRVNRKNKNESQINIDNTHKYEGRDINILNKDLIINNKERAKNNNKRRKNDKSTSPIVPQSVIDNSKPYNIPTQNVNNNKKDYSNKNNNSNSWSINEERDSYLNNQGDNKNNINNSSLRGSGSNFGNKRKIHTLRSISKINNKYVNLSTNLNNRIYKDKFINKYPKSLKTLLNMLRMQNSRVINKSWLLDKINKLNVNNLNDNTILNRIKEFSFFPSEEGGLSVTQPIGLTMGCVSELNGIEMIDDIERRKNESLNIWNLLNENWNLSEYNNLTLPKGNDIKGKIRHKRNYIKFVKDNYKNDKQAKYKKMVIMAKVENILEKNKMNLKSVLDLKYKIKWDKFDKSVIRMILMLLMSSNKRVYNKNIETYLKMRRKDIGRGRPKSRKKMKNESNLNIITSGNISRKNKKLNKKIGADFKKYLHYSFERLIGTIKNKIINNDKLYIDIIRKEFYKINRDVIVSKTTENYNNESDTFNNSYDFGYHTNNINTRFTITWNEISQFSLKLWQTLNLNKREENLMHVLSFSDKTFKPYYRYIIRLFILVEYRKFINRLGFKSILLHLNLPFHFGNGVSGTKFTWIKDNSLKIFNFIAVKTLFNIFKFNYRSLYIIKPKFYHINKFRLFKRKAKRLNFNTWLRSIRYLKTLRKAPNSYWLRYHKLISKYYKRIISHAKWDAERKVLMPYVLYFEDLLYNIYGKLALVRIWPLKKYFLSIYILTERLMLLLDKNAHRKKRRQNLMHLFTRFVLNFLNIINKTKIDRIYESNLGSNSRWPTELITEVNKDLPLASNYNKLEYFSKKLDLAYQLNSYILKYSQLDDFIDIPDFDYPKIAKDQYLKIQESGTNMIKQRLNIQFKKGFMQYWVRPIKNMFLDINRTQDIRGFLFKLAGKAKGIPRKFNIWHQRGSFLGARHYNKLTYRYITISSMHIRNSIRPTMEHTQRSGVFPAGATNLKVWYSSLLSSDVMELIFYLLKKKVVYDALMNRNFFVHKNIQYFLHYNKWTSDHTEPLFDKLIFLNYKMNNRFNKYYKRNKKSRYLNFGIAVKTRFIRHLRDNKMNKIFRLKSPFTIKKSISYVK
jgi:hypothetical protein